MRPRTLLFVVLAVWALVPGWTGDERLPLFGPDAIVRARRVPLDPADPARRQLGRLTYLGGVELMSPDPAFGGFSALHVRGDRVTLLSDGGNWARFRLGSDGTVTNARFGDLPGGPGSGWRKRDRDSEGLAVDDRTSTAWVSFERANAIWRYGPGGVQRASFPEAMRRWRSNGGAETLMRRRDGSFLAMEEEGQGDAPTREMLVWRSDPTLAPAPSFRLHYRPPAGFDPTDATELPDGRLLVLNRWWGLPLRFASSLVVIDRGAIRPGAVVHGREIARLAAPLQSANYEGVAATQEGGRTIVWLVCDNDGMWRRPSLLLKFALAP